MAERGRIRLRNSASASRYRVSMPSEKIFFSRKSFTQDMMWQLDGRERNVSVLHMVDTQTPYHKAMFLKGESVREVRDAFLEGWATTCICFSRKMN